MNLESREIHEVYWPRGPRQTQKKPLAKRLKSLEGKTIAQLWDFVYRGDEIFAALEEGLRARYAAIRIISWKEFGSTHGTDEAEVLAGLPRRLRELGVDAVVSGMGC